MRVMLKMNLREGTMSVKLVSDMDSISSNDHSAIIGDSDKSDADGEDFVGTLRSMTAIEE
jgi:hypothetical protein